MEIRRNLFIPVLLSAISGIARCAVVQLNQNPFPENFTFGVATASYQIEGAWDTNGKGENIWDHFTHNNPGKVYGAATGNIACDSYNKYKEDVQMIKALGVAFYRFSLSWSRILPTGFINQVNEDGITYYNNLIDELIANGIEPMITIFHWDLPQPLQDAGGWPNSLLIEPYVDFARLAFKSFGDRVKSWITFNEPKQICKFGYGDGTLAPGLKSSGLADYMCVYTVMIAHAKAYHMYDQEFRPTQNGLVGFTTDCFWFKPKTDSAADIEAADRLFEFYTGIFTNPIFGSGDFPQVVKDQVKTRSIAQGFTSSRLPSFTESEVELLKGTSDFYGLNIYTTVLVENVEEAPLTTVGWDSDSRVGYSWDPSWQTAASTWLKVVPEGMKETLKNLKAKYGDVPIIVTENGFSDHGGLKDYDRANYYLMYLSACLDAIYEHNVNLISYTAWSLMDNFEWVHGYENRFGIHDVNFNDPNRPRTRKLSAEIYTTIAADRKLPNTTLEKSAGTSVSPPQLGALFVSVLLVGAVINVSS